MSLAYRRAPRALAALAAVAALVAMLAVAAPASAQTSTITRQDCLKGTIRDRNGNPIPRERCLKLVGRRVRLAGTGFDVRLIGIGGVACIAAAAALGLRRRRVPELA